MFQKKPDNIQKKLEALLNQSSITDEDYEKIKKYQEILEIRKIHKTNRINKYLFPTLFFLSISIISILNYTKVKTTPVYLSASTRYVTLSTKSEIGTSSRIPIQNIRIQNLKGYEIYNGSDPVEYPNSKGLLFIEKIDSKTKSELFLDLAGISSQTELEILSTESRIHIKVKHKDGLSLKINSKGRIRFKDKKEITSLDSDHFLSTVVEGSDRDLILIAEVQKGFDFELISQTEVSDMSFSKVVKKRISEKVVEKEISDILNGKLVLENVGNKVIDLRRNEVLSGNLNGNIYSLRVREGNIEMEFYGEGTNLRKSFASNQKNINPSILENIYHNSSWTLLWGVALYIFGLFKSTINWLKN